MARFVVDRKDVVRAVDACGLFSSLRPAIRSVLVDAFEGVRLTTGETLMTQGDAADDLFIVRHGRLQVTVDDGLGNDIPVGEIGRNEVVGEMALITDQDRSATIRARRDTDLYRLHAGAFGKLVQRHPEVLRPFASVVVNRLRAAMTMPTRPALPATIVLLPAGDHDLHALAAQLADTFAPYTTAIVSAEDVADRSNPAAWLLEIENVVDISVLIADREPNEWSQLCLRQADRVELIATENADPGLTAIERDPTCRARIATLPLHLVMLYDRQARTSDWLGARTLASQVNVRRTSPQDIERLGRLISGRASILVLGGGGARGFAHLGVTRALEEGGIPIDGIIATSAGSVVGGALAYASGTDEAEQMILDWFDKVRWRRDFNPPSVSFLSGRTMSTGLAALSSGANIEDLRIGFAAVSCDLVTATPYVHDRGPLWQAIRASASVPGLFPPLAVDGRLLVDGGLVANMPTAIARSRHPSAELIAVEVGDPTDVDLGGLDGSGVVNGWQRLRHRTDVGGASLARLLMRLTELGRDDSAEHADIVISPDVRGFGLIETKRARDIIQRGYEAGVRAIEDGVISSRCADRTRRANPANGAASPGRP